MGVKLDSNSSLTGKQNHSCCYSGLSELVDEDMDELLNASQDAIRGELIMHGYEPDQLVRDLLIDLNPKIDRIPIKKSRDERLRINYFKEAFSVIQEALLESLLNKVPKQPIWRRQPIFSGAIAFAFLFLSFLSIFIFSSIDNKVNTHEIVADNKKNYLPTSSNMDGKLDIVTAKSEDDETNTEISNEEAFNLVSSETLEMLDKLSESEIEALNKFTYAYIESGGKFEPTDDSIKFLEKVTEKLPTSPQLINASLGKEKVFCSNTGFYSHIIERNETLISVANKCGFKSNNLNTAKNVPTLNETDVVHFNFGQNRDLTKITVYQDDDFHILDFKEGKFIEKSLLDEEKSIIVDIDLKNNYSLYQGLKNSDVIGNKGNLWEKVADKINKEYSDMIVMSKISANTKYQINIKYRHNTVKDYYDVVSVSLEKYEG